MIAIVIRGQMVGRAAPWRRLEATPPIAGPENHRPRRGEPKRHPITQRYQVDNANPGEFGLEQDVAEADDMIEPGTRSCELMPALSISSRAC